MRWLGAALVNAMTTSPAIAQELFEFQRHTSHWTSPETRDAPRGQDGRENQRHPSELQQGQEPTLETRRMESIGAGVYELKQADERAWYRVIYLSKIDDVIYVLHCFKKQSRKTDKRDLKIATERLSRVRRRIEEQRKYAKRRTK